MPEAKPTNPKDVIGSTKLPMELVPDTLTAYASLAFLEGALKYGRFNWRIAGVRASIYRAALQRHLAKWWNGEWADAETEVPHLASVIACAAIILDARQCGKLEDDRPPVQNIGALLDVELREVSKHLQKLFENEKPHQYTINDSDPREVLELDGVEWEHVVLESEPEKLVERDVYLDEVYERAAKALSWPAHELCRQRPRCGFCARALEKACRELESEAFDRLPRC